MNSKLKFTKQKHSPLELVKTYWPDAPTDHIVYMPEMKHSDRQYWRVEQCGGDGLLVYTVEMFQKLLLPIVNQTTYCKKYEPIDWENITHINYIIGPISHVTVYGRLKLRCGGTFPGQRERVRMPVICKLIRRIENEKVATARNPRKTKEIN